MLKLKLMLAMALIVQASAAYAAVLPELPRVYVDTSMPTTSITKTVCQSGCDYTNDKLQQAIDEAQLGTTILLQQGVTYTPLDDRGFILKNKTSGSGWIIIKPAGADTILPPPGSRLTPSYSSVMPKIVRKAVGGVYAMNCDTSAHHYRIIGIEMMNPGNIDTSIIGAAFVNCSSVQETTLASQSHHILFDRVYIHGPSAGGSAGVKFGLVLNGQHEGVINSTIEDITFGSDAITVANWGGAGPFVIANNTLSSSGENIMFGGADAQVLNLVPSDIEIRHNYIYKPLKWRDDPAYNSGTRKILAKNLFETKNSQRALIDSNVFENMWPSAQPGFAMTFTPRQGSLRRAACDPDGCAPWTVVQDITITNNVIKSTANGITFSGREASDTTHYGTQLGGRVLIKNNLMVNTGGYPGAGTIFQLGNGAFDVTIQHNTVASPNEPTGGTSLKFTYGAANSDYTQMERFTLQDNLLLGQNYPIFAGGGCTAAGLSSVAPGYVWTNSALTGPWPTPVGCASSKLPQGNGNAYPASEADLGYTDLSGADYRLSSVSPYKKAASDGKDIGVDWPSFDLAQDPTNIAPPSVISTPTTTETSPTTGTSTTTSTSPSTTTTTTTVTTTTTSPTQTTTTGTEIKSSGRFLGKLKQLMDKVR